MRRFLSLFIICCLAINCLAQTQQGVVKTKGRMVNGKHVPGQGLSGATVTIQGRNAVQSQANGVFSFPIPSKTFMLQGVQKNGYQLVDVDATGKSYNYSPNTFYIVMESPMQIKRDKQDAASAVRHSLYSQYLEKDAELKRKLEEHEILQSEYIKQKELLDSLQNSNEKLVEEMALKYTMIDFDQLDEFNRIVSELIINGELTKADSMINSRGNLEERISKLQQNQVINQQEAEQIVERQNNLAKSQMFVENEKDIILKDCYNIYLIKKMQHQYDSAAYYICLGANLDTLNVEWQLEAGNYIDEYTDDIENNALYYYTRALNVAKSKYGDNHPEVAKCIIALGKKMAYRENYEQAEDYLLKALQIMTDQYGKNSSQVADCYMALGYALDDSHVSERGNLFIVNDKSIDYYEKALAIRIKVFGERSLEAAECYEVIGLLKGGMDKEMAIDYYEKALSIYIDSLGEDSPEVAMVYLNYAHTYELIDAHDRWLFTEEQMAMNGFDGNEYMYFHPDCYDDLIEIEQITIHYYEKALNNLNLVYGDNYPKVKMILDFIEETKSYIEINKEEKEEAIKERNAD